MKLSRRPAQPTDTEFARATHHAAYQDVVIRQFGVWDEAAQDQFFETDWFAIPHEIIESDGVACGYVAIIDRADHIHFHSIVIVPEFQGRGIGTQLLREAIARGQARNLPVRLGVLLKNRAVDLYKRMGFVEYARTEIHILMECNTA